MYLNLTSLLANNFCNTLQLTKNSARLYGAVINVRNSEVKSSANAAGRKEIRKAALEGTTSGTLLSAYCSNMYCDWLCFICDDK